MTWAGFLDEAQQPKWATNMELRIKSLLTEQGAQIMGLKDELDAILAENAAARDHGSQPPTSSIASVSQSEPN